jgi:hypothetical protein
MKYIVVSANASRGRNDTLFKRIELARVPEATSQDRPNQRDAVLSITVTDKDSPLWGKGVDDLVEIA